MATEWATSLDEGQDEVSAATNNTMGPAAAANLGSD